MRMKRHVSPQLLSRRPASTGARAPSALVWCGSLQYHLRAHRQNWLLPVLINLGKLRRDYVLARIGLFPFVLVGNVLRGIFDSFTAPPERENPIVQAVRAQWKAQTDVELWPTKEETEAVFKRHKYRIDRLHFAVCGAAGSGKSSLINAFRGLKAQNPGAAAVGVVETTTEIARYPDTRPGMPYELFVWYDIPGAGTVDVPSIQYFKEQGLFIFDFIVLVYDAVKSPPHPTQQ